MLRELAITDQLTKLYNRLMLDRTLEQEIGKAERYGSEFGVIMLDIDDFKSVNDNYGHQTGDKVLIEMAELLQKYSRDADVVGRWGGEEILIICPNSTREGIMVLAENIRQKIEKNRFSEIDKITSSFGVATYQKGDECSGLIYRADQALYRAKDKGKNRVESLFGI